MLVALTVAVGTALASAALFGVSLALGAFVAGIVVNESPFSHQIGADLLPFREAFAVIFFVSVGMLVDPSAVAAHWGQLIVTVAAHHRSRSQSSPRSSAFVLPYPAHTALVVAAGRGQIGEFSFILGQTGVALGLLTPEQYSLILAGAIVSITLNPFVLRLVEPIERALKRRPALWRGHRSARRSTRRCPRRRSPITSSSSAADAWAGTSRRRSAGSASRGSSSRSDPSRIEKLQGARRAGALRRRRQLGDSGPRRRSSALARWSSRCPTTRRRWRW